MFSQMQNTVKTLKRANILLFLVLFFVLDIKRSSGETSRWKGPTGCPEQFKGKCQCGLRPFGSDGRESYVTNCTNTNFTDINMLTQMSPQTEVLIFTGNNLVSLPPNFIGLDARYERLHTIDLSNNKIKLIRGKSFHNVKAVKELILNDNEILIDDDNEFHPRIFSNFKSLEVLRLKNAFDNSIHDMDFLNDLWITFNDSSITTLKVLDLDDNHIRSSFPSPHIFCSLPSLQRLHLSNNFLTDFPLNLTCLKDLNLIDISYNFITTLSNRSLALIESGPPNYHINLTMNSFRCDCNLIDFFLWTKAEKDIRVDSVEKFQCVNGHPMDNAGRFFDDLSVADLECYDSVKNDDFKEYISISYAILTSLLLTLSGLVVALIYINRQYIRNGWTYLMTGIASKREYTSLEQQSKRLNKANQEVAEVEV